LRNGGDKGPDHEPSRAEIVPPPEAHAAGIAAPEPPAGAAPDPAPDAASSGASEPAATPLPGLRRSRVSGFWGNLRWLLGVLLIVFFVRTFIGEATIIPTGSMENTILVGDHVFLNKLLYGPRVPFTDVRLPVVRSVQRQDIIAFRYPGDPLLIYVKRVIGLAGDTVEIRRGKVFVNGKPLDEPYLVMANPPLRENFGPVTIPAGHFFVMGDNRDNSHDSRFWGSVPEANVVGEPLLVYWSYEASTDEWLTEGAMNRARFYQSVLTNFFSKTRWSRTGLWL
jgi:signal peptidase I